MKTMHAYFLIILPVFILLLQCCKEDEKSSDHTISLTRTEKFGCSEQVLPLNTKASYDDTLFYSIQDGTLTLRVLMDYNCCGLLTDSVDISGPDVNIFVKDTCAIDCSCRCTCRFQFYYYFTDFWQKNTYFKVYLKEFGATEYILWRQTSFIDGLD